MQDSSSSQPLPTPPSPEPTLRRPSILRNAFVKDVPPQSTQPQAETSYQDDQSSYSDADYSDDENEYYDEYPQEYFPGTVKPQVEELVYEWQAPSRPFKQRSKQFYTTVITISTLISLILFLSGQILPIAVIVAVVFLFYVLSTIEPGNVITQLTTYGIRHEEQLYFWEELGRFWLDETYGQRMIHIEVARFPNRLTLLVGQGDEAQLIDMLSEVLIFEKPAPTTYEKIAQWLEKQIPLEVEKK